MLPTLTLPSILAHVAGDGIAFGVDVGAYRHLPPLVHEALHHKLDLPPVRLPLVRDRPGPVASAVQRRERGLPSKAEMPSSAAAAKALKRLVADGLIYLFGDEYRFFNPFLRTWLLSKGY